jgi:uncharacterized protein (TIGR03643 family)
VLSAEEIDRIIEMAWEDRTPFDAIQSQFGLNEDQVKQLMREHMKDSSYRMWRKRVQGRITKHQKLRPFTEGRHKAKGQKIGWVFRGK